MLDDILWKDEKGASSLRWTLELFQRQHWGNLCEMGWSTCELSERIEIHHLELNSYWNLQVCASRGIVIGYGYCIHACNVSKCVYGVCLHVTVLELCSLVGQTVKLQVCVCYVLHVLCCAIDHSVLLMYCAMSSVLLVECYCTVLRLQCCYFITLLCCVFSVVTVLCYVFSVVTVLCYVFSVVTVLHCVFSVVTVLCCVFSVVTVLCYVFSVVTVLGYIFSVVTVLCCVFSVFTVLCYVFSVVTYCNCVCRGGKICLTDHFKPLWARNVPKFGIAHAMALGVRSSCAPSFLLSSALLRKTRWISHRHCGGVCAVAMLSFHVLCYLKTKQK